MNQLINMQKRIAILFATAIILIMDGLSVDAEYEHCLLPEDVGPCRARKSRWYYDSATDECVSFFYGGCSGNENNFLTEQDCEDACKDVCDQPRVIGPCRAAVPRWYYNKETSRCTSFTYGGCQGNGNNFETLEQCQSICEN